MSEGPLQLTADEEIELLVGAPKLHVGPHGDRIVALAQGVQQLMYPDGLATAIALLEIVSFQHPGDGVLRRQTNHAVRPELAHPDRVEADLGELGVQNLEHLAAIRVCIALEILPAQRFPGEVPAARIADETGEIADQEHHVMAELLELTHLVEEHGVPEVEVGRRGVETRLDAQRFAALELCDQISLQKDLVHTSANDGKRIVEPGQDSSRCRQRAQQVITASSSTAAHGAFGSDPEEESGCRRRTALRSDSHMPIPDGEPDSDADETALERSVAGPAVGGAQFVRVAAGNAGR